jgi:heme-degrading monooxygenase HmoA
MDRFLVLAEIYVDVLEFTNLEEWFKEVHAQNLPGLETFDLWRAPEPGKYLLTSVYAKVEQADKAFEWMTEHPLIEQLESRQSVPDVHAGPVVSASGHHAGHRWLSSVVTRAQPGYGDEKQEELENILSDISFLDGFKGSLLARNGEEFMSVAYWSSSQAFQDSIPMSPAHDARLYERVPIGPAANVTA